MVSYREMVDAFNDSGLVSSEEVPLDPQGRLSRLIQRVKEEYRFDQPDFHVDESKFEKVSDPNANEKLLYDSLCNAMLVDGALEHIEMTLYGENGYRSVFLRSCYFDLFEIILNSLQIFDYNRKLILGSPGIGKSWFHVFCLYVLIKANAPVCLQRSEQIALYYKGEVYSYQIDKMRKVGGDEFSESNMWFLYDRNERPVWRKNISIFVSSILNKRDYKEYSRCCTTMFMPLWNYTELLHANRVRPIDKRLSEKHLLEAYLLCGGIVQNIFDNFVHYRMNYNLLLDNISMSDLKHGKLKEMNSQIIGLVVWEKYFWFERKLLSKSIGRDVFLRLSYRAGITMQQILNNHEYANYLKPVPFACEGLKELGMPKKSFSLHSLYDKKINEVISFPEGLQIAEFTGHTLDNVLWEPSIPAKLWIPQFSTFP